VYIYIFFFPVSIIENYISNKIKSRIFKLFFFAVICPHCSHRRCEGPAIVWTAARCGDGDSVYTEQLVQVSNNSSAK
jgi:hypothetical protein